MENKIGFSRVSSPPVTTPLVAGVAPYTVGPLAITPPCYHSICNLAEVCSRSLAAIITVSAPPSCRAPVHVDHHRGCVR